MALIEIRKLAAVDMAWLGKRIVIAEYALGMALPLALGLWSLRLGFGGSGIATRPVVFGLWLLGIAANYVPLFFYSVAIARAGTVEIEGRPEIANAGRYGVQQSMILVPVLVVIVAMLQERTRSKAGH